MAKFDYSKKSLTSSREKEYQPLKAVIKVIIDYLSGDLFKVRRSYHIIIL